MKSWRNEKLASRGLSRAVLFQKSAFVASRARHHSRRGLSTFEKPLFPPSMCFALGRRTAQETSDRAPVVQFLLDNPLCVRERRRNRVLGLRALAFPLACGRGGPRGTRRVSPPLWPSVSIKRMRNKHVYSVNRWNSYTLLRERHATHVTT